MHVLIVRKPVPVDACLARAGPVPMDACLDRAGLVPVDACLDRAGPLSSGINTVHQCCCTCQSKNATPLDQNAPIRVHGAKHAFCQKTAFLTENGHLDRNGTVSQKLLIVLTDKMDKSKSVGY